MTILAVYRDPFGITPQVRHLPEDENLLAMAERMDGLPDGFFEHGAICINGHVVPRAVWGMVRPKPISPNTRTEVTFHAAPMGGDSGDGKQVLAIIASIALTVLTGFIAGGGLATLLGAGFAKGTIGALLLSTGVSVVGSLIIAGMTSPPVRADQPQSDNRGAGKTLGAASATGNVLQPNGPVPRVVGTRKIFPPLGMEPLTYFDGEDEIVEAAFVLAGPHKLDDIRVGGSPITDGVGIESETREGWPGDTPVALLSRQSRTEAIGTALRGHQVADDGVTLESTTGIEGAIPVATSVVTGASPDEVQLQLVFPQGLSKNADTTIDIRVPFRVRMRIAGGNYPWTNLPEIHFRASSVSQMRATIRLVWTSSLSDIEAVEAGDGWVEARNSAITPTATTWPPTYDYTADSYFGVSSGYVTYSLLGSKNVKNTQLGRYEAKFELDTAVFPKGRYEIELVRGAPFKDSLYVPSAYYADGYAVWDLFGAAGSVASPNTLPFSKKGVADAVYFQRMVSLWNEHPVPTDDFAIVAIKARNRQVGNLSVVASGYVQDWDGSGWNTWTTTSNPAPHLRDVFVGLMNADPVPAAIVDDTMLTDWRTACDAAGYSCNAIMEGQSVADAAQIIAGTGYGRPYMSDVWGVVRDYDRSAETPVQIFTPRNSNGFSWRKGFAKVPDGFLITYPDRALDYAASQIVEPVSATDGLLEQVSYEGIVDENAARVRARFDLLQARLRSTFYSLTVPAEAIVCRRGSLVGVAHDTFNAHTGAGRVIGITFDGAGAVSAITLDDLVPVSNELYLEEQTALETVDWTTIGLKTGVALRRTDGTKTLHQVSNASGETDTLTFSPSITAAGIAEDTLCVVGIVGREYERLLVFDIEPREDLTARLTLVDEAPSIWDVVSGLLDTTAPLLSAATAYGSGPYTATASVISDEANGTLYMVVTTSATAPSAAQVKAGQDNSGVAAAYSASQPVTTTGTQDISPDPFGLAASTLYNVFFMHEDAAGNQSTIAVGGLIATSAPFPDTTAPLLTSPTDAANGSTAATASVGTDEANGTLYAVVTSSSTPPTAAQVKAGQDNSSASAAWSGSQAVGTTGVQTLSPAPSGLTASTAYTTHFMHEDGAGNQSLVATASGFTTSAGADTTAPTLSAATDAASGLTTSTASVSTDEANGALYMVVTTSATAPTKAQVKAGQDNSGVAAAFAGSQTVSATGVQTVSPAPSGLAIATAYTTHFMHEDGAGNQSTVSSASGFTTYALSTFITSRVDPANWTSPGYLFSAVPVANGRTVLAIFNQGGSTIGLTGITIGGVAMTKRVSAVASNIDVSLWDLVTSGGTANIQTTQSSSGRCGIALWDVGSRSFVASATASAGTTLTLDINTQAGDTVIGYQGTNDASYANATAGGGWVESVDEVVEANYFHSGYLAANAAGGTPEAFSVSETVVLDYGLAALYR